MTEILVSCILIFLHSCIFIYFPYAYAFRIFHDTKISFNIYWILFALEKICSAPCSVFGFDYIEIVEPVIHESVISEISDSRIRICQKDQFPILAAVGIAVFWYTLFVHWYLGPLSIRSVVDKVVVLSLCPPMGISMMAWSL